jgi:hypothetical protein
VIGSSFINLDSLEGETVQMTQQQGTFRRIHSINMSIKAFLKHHNLP